jgi:hypothetical protein
MTNDELFDAARTAIGLIIDRLPCQDAEQAVTAVCGAMAGVVDRALVVGLDDARLLAQLNGSLVLAKKGNATLIDDIETIGRA